MKNNNLLKFNTLLSFLYLTLMIVDYLRLTYTFEDDIGVGVMTVIIILFAVPHILTQIISFIMACVSIFKDKRNLVFAATLTHTLSTFICFPYMFFPFVYYYFVFSLIITSLWIKIWYDLKVCEKI